MARCHKTKTDQNKSQYYKDVTKKKMHENHKQAARYPINEATPIPLGDWCCIEPILFTLLNQINLAASNKGSQNKIK